MSGEVIIVGGGLAGLAAAVRLIESGQRVRLLESRRRLGGRASSFDDARSGLCLDNCQHVLMGCCTNLLDLYDRLGVADAIEWHERTWWLRPDGGVDVLKPGWLPAPLHMAGAMRRMRLLSFAAKRRVAVAVWRMLRMGPGGRRSLRGRTFGDLLRQWGQCPESRRRFWDPIIVSACNLDVDEVAAVHAVQVMQEGFLAGKWHATMGIPRVPLRSLYEPATSVIEEGGGEVHLGVKVAEIAIEGRQVRGVQTNRGFLSANVVVAAVPCEQLRALVPSDRARGDARLTAAASLGHSPILGVHLTVDRTILHHPHLVLPECDVHWLFNKGVHSDGSQDVHAVISAADAWMTFDEAEITHRVHQAIRRLDAGVEVRSCRPIKERRATFRATPAAESHRPHAAPRPIGPDGGDIEGLYLAGDWCATGWPATMEGAVRSGYAAARAVTGTGGVVDDAPPGRIVRWLASGAPTG